MKHAKKITLIIISMFILTQFIGLYVVNSNPFYDSQDNGDGVIEVANPYLPEMGPLEKEAERGFAYIFFSIIVAFVISIGIFLLLTRFKLDVILRLWFFLVVSFALFISFNAFIPKLILVEALALLTVFLLAYFKIYHHNFILHNLTEFFIYPGVAAVFVPILGPVSVVALLVLISVYDMWAVWKSGLMQKMAKYQVKKLGIFSGFFIPYLDDKTRAKIKKMKKSDLKKKKIKVNVAILGGGDVVFPIITSGVYLMSHGLIQALGVIIGATAGLSYLLFMGEKKKFYPAMPYITLGILLGLGLSFLI